MQKAGLDYSAAMSAVNAAASLGGACGSQATGHVATAVTFAPNGHATRAVLESGPLRGSSAGSCVARHLTRATIAPFDGDLVTVQSTVVLR
jgi:hypothetical protein